jgi:hypothetical protein
LSIETSTKIGLISKALILCGEMPLTSLSDDRYGATVGANLFELLYENELQGNHAWRFCCKKDALSRLVDVPLNQWQYAYQLPPDMLLPNYVYPRTRYEIYGDRIYTDATSVELDYRFKPDINALPAHFALLLVYSLAKDMIKPITESDRAQQIMQAKYDIQRNRALFADAQGRPNVPIQDSPFVDVR